MGDVGDKAAEVQGNLPGGGELSASQLQALVQKLRTQAESLEASLPVDLPAGAAESRLQAQIESLQEKAENLESQLSGGAPASKLQTQVQHLRTQVQNLRDKAQTLDGGLPADLPGPASELQNLPNLADRLNNGGSTNVLSNTEVDLPDAYVGIQCNGIGLLGDALADCPDGPTGDNGGGLSIETDDLSTGGGIGGGDGGNGGGALNNSTLELPDAYVGMYCNSAGILGDAAATCASSFSGGSGGNGGGGNGGGGFGTMMHSAASDPNNGGGLLNNTHIAGGNISANASCNAASVFGNAGSNCGSGEVPGPDDGGSDDGGSGITVPIECNSLGLGGGAAANCGDGDGDGGDGDGDGNGDNGDNGDNGGDDGDNGDDDGAAPGPGAGGDQLPVTGLNLGSLLALALGALAAGAACVVAAIRRPRVNRG